jgi:hypothetical protein
MEDLDDVQCAPVAFAWSGGITHLISRRATSCPYMDEAQRVAVPKHQTAPLCVQALLGLSNHGRQLR